MSVQLLASVHSGNVRVEQPAGDAISLNGQRFVICDPTYIGAPVGRTMPGMDNTTAKAIIL